MKKRNQKVIVRLDGKKMTRKASTVKMRREVKVGPWSAATTVKPKLTRQVCRGFQFPTRVVVGAALVAKHRCKTSSPSGNGCSPQELIHVYLWNTSSPSSDH